jgi:hypothetical protein
MGGSGAPDTTAQTTSETPKKVGIISRTRLRR